MKKHFFKQNRIQKFHNKWWQWLSLGLEKVPRAKVLPHPLSLFLFLSDSGLSATLAESQGCEGHMITFDVGRVRIRAPWCAFSLLLTLADMCNVQLSTFSLQMDWHPYYPPSSPATWLDRGLCGAHAVYPTWRKSPSFTSISCFGTSVAINTTCEGNCVMEQKWLQSLLAPGNCVSCIPLRSI